MTPFSMSPRFVSRNNVDRINKLREQAEPFERVPGDNGGLAYRWRMGNPKHELLLSLIEVGMRRAKTIFGYDVTGLDYLQWAEYSVGCGLGLHTDTYPLTSQFDGLQRKLSFTLQLTEGSEYEGGDLVLYRKPTEPEPDPELRGLGTIIFFPSFTPHYVLPVTKGVRQALVGWFRGPQWR